MRVRTLLLQLIVLIGGAMLLALGACGSSQDSGRGDQSANGGRGGTQAAPMTRRSDLGAGRPPRVRYGNLNRAGMSSRQTDINGDGHADQVEYFRDGKLVFIERDLDFDGTPDLFEYFNAAGELIEQEFQLDYDLAIDAVRFYNDGVVTEKLVSTDFDGSATIWKYFDQSGELTRLERDTNADGVPDEWHRFEDGELVGIQTDTNGDGQPDTDVEIGR